MFKVKSLNAALLGEPLEFEQRNILNLFIQHNHFHPAQSSCRFLPSPVTFKRFFPTMTGSKTTSS